MLIATHAAAICESIAPTGRTVVALTVTAQDGDYGSIMVTPTHGAILLADVGPAGIHAWRWADLDDWSRASVDTAAEALERGM